jgi:hypothetical protein
MRVTLANKLIDGMETRVFDPETGVAFPRDAIIDLDLYPYAKQQHFLRIVADGDLIEVLDEAQPIKTEKAK